MKLTKKMIKDYLVDCKGYDELMLEELEENFGKDLIECLDVLEIEDCKNYWR
jgi:hypothetical protein